MEKLQNFIEMDIWQAENPRLIRILFVSNCHRLLQSITAHPFLLNLPFHAYYFQSRDILSPVSSQIHILLTRRLDFLRPKTFFLGAQVSWTREIFPSTCTSFFLFFFFGNFRSSWMRFYENRESRLVPRDDRKLRGMSRRSFEKFSVCQMCQKW